LGTAVVYALSGTTAYLDFSLHSALVTTFTNLKYAQTHYKNTITNIGFSYAQYGTTILKICAKATTVCTYDGVFGTNETRHIGP
jgi:hypothetical protein